MPTMQEPAKKERGIPYMIAMSTLTVGYGSVDFISNYFLGIVIKHFTMSPFLIACILDLNRLFGFVVQPYVAWKSDRVQTRFGRRRPFLLVGLPITMMCMLLVGWMPFLFEGETRHAWMTITLLFAVNLVFQAAQDINGGAEGPLYADSFDQNKLGRAASFRTVSNQLMLVFMSLFALRLADINEIYPFVVSACFMVLALMIVIFIIREDPTAKMAPREAYNPLKHLGLLVSNRDYAKVAALGAMNLMFPAAYTLFLILYATETLKLTKTDYGLGLVGGQAYRGSDDWTAGGARGGPGRAEIRDRHRFRPAGRGGCVHGFRRFGFLVVRRGELHLFGRQRDAPSGGVTHDLPVRSKNRAGAGLWPDPVCPGLISLCGLTSAGGGCAEMVVRGRLHVLRADRDRGDVDHPHHPQG